LRVERRSARPACLLVGPLPSDQRAVPAQQRLGRDEKRCPPLSGEHPAGGNEQDLVARGELGPAGLATQHPKLMPQDQNLQVLVPSSGSERTSRRVSRRTISQSRKSIDGWYGTPAHDANPGFRAPQDARREPVGLVGALVGRPAVAPKVAVVCWIRERCRSRLSFVRRRERLRRWKQGSVASVLRPQQTADEDVSESGWVRDIEVSTPMQHGGSQHVAEIALIPAVRGEGMQHRSAPPGSLLR
jgi:hypothetical protein